MVHPVSDAAVAKVTTRVKEERKQREEILSRPRAERVRKLDVEPGRLTKKQRTDKGGSIGNGHFKLEMSRWK